VHLIINKAEQRIRAGFRVIFYIIFASLVLVLNTIKIGGVQFILTACISFGFFWIMYRFVDNRSSIKIAGIYLNNLWWKEFSWGAIVAAFVMTTIFLFQWITGTIEFLGFSWNLPGSSNWIFPILIFFLQMASVGFYEELITRSYLLPNFKEGFTNGYINTTKATIIAVVLSSSIFGIMHILNNYVTIFAVLNIILAGVMLAIPYIITGRLAYSVGIHFAWNFFQGGVYGFRVSGIPIRGSIIQIQQGGDALWTGASFGPEGGIIGTLGIISTTILCLVMIKKSRTLIELHSNFRKTYLEFERYSKEKE
jgi:membrane protease YdiL (CAAX protease family)